MKFKQFLSKNYDYIFAFWKKSFHILGQQKHVIYIKGRPMRLHIQTFSSTRGLATWKRWFSPFSPFKRWRKKKSMLIVLSTFVFCILETMTFSGVTLTFSWESLDDSVAGLQIISAHQGDVMLAWPPQKQSCLLIAASLNNREKK